MSGPPITMTAEQIEAIATRATEAATQNIAAKNRHRLVWWGLLAGMIVASAIAIPVTIALTHESDRKAIAAQHDNSLHNCESIRDIASVDQAKLQKSKVNSKRFEEESKDRFGLPPKRFKELIAENQREEQERIERLKAIADTNCARAIQ